MIKDDSLYVHTKSTFYRLQPIFKFALTEALSEHCLNINEDPNKWFPYKHHFTDTGWDVRCAELDGIELKHGYYVKMSLGFRVFSPPGWWLKLAPRSSTLTKKNIHALYGVIDETYEGEMFFCGQLSLDKQKLDKGENTLYIPFGERIGQIIPVRREDMIIDCVSNKEFDQLCAERNASRGSGGFGSSGNS